MKKLILLCVSCALITCPLFIISCSEAEEAPKKEELPPPVFNMKIVSSIYLSETGILSPGDPIKVFFNGGDGVEQLIEGNTYRAVLDDISLVRSEHYA